MSFAGRTYERMTPTPVVAPPRRDVLFRRPVHRSAPHTAPPSVHGTLRRPGQALDASTRGRMESRFGHDFSRVRVHTDDEAVVSAQAVGAAAYTVGRHVVFGKDRFAPSGAEGQELLAHELAHVVQQGGGASSRPASEARILSPLPRGWPRGRDRDGATTGMLGGMVALPLTPPLGHPQEGGLEREPSGTLRIADPDSPAERAAEAASRSGAVALDQTAAGLSVQRQETEEGEEHVPPAEQQEAWPGFHPDSDPAFQLQLDPAFQPDRDVARIVEQMLAQDRIRRSLFGLDYSSFLRTPPPWLSPAPSLEQEPLVPAGAGPATPRPGEAGDVLKAVLQVPSVSSALDRLRTEAASQAQREWGRLGTGERVLFVTQTALVGGTALGVGLAHEETRGPILNLIQNTPLQVPGVPGLTFQFNVTGPDQRIQFGLDVGALLPPSLGFRGGD